MTPNILPSRKRGGSCWHMELAYWFFGLRMPRGAGSDISVEGKLPESFQLADWYRSQAYIFTRTNSTT